MKKKTEDATIALIALVCAGSFLAGMAFIVLLARIRGWF